MIVHRLLLCLQCICIPYKSCSHFHYAHAHMKKSDIALGRVSFFPFFLATFRHIQSMSYSIWIEYELEAGNVLIVVLHLCTLILFDNMIICLGCLSLFLPQPKASQIKRGKCIAADENWKKKNRLHRCWNTRFLYVHVHVYMYICIYLVTDHVWCERCAVQRVFGTKTCNPLPHERNIHIYKVFHVYAVFRWSRIVVQTHTHTSRKRQKHTHNVPLNFIM